MNRNVFLIHMMRLCLLSGCLLGLGCSDASPNRSGDSSEPATLYYFTWSDYVEPASIAQFEQIHHVRVVVDTFSSNEELLAKVQTGMTGYDVVVPSDFMAGIMGRLGLLAELDGQRIPNIRHLEDALQHLPFDPEHRFAIPYLWGTVGIGYDAEVVSEAPRSWQALWDPAFAGRISMLNDQREVFGLALKALGYSLNSQSESEIRQARDMLIKQKPLVKAYTSEQFDQLLVSGEVVLAHAWGGPVARAMRERSSIRYEIPQEGGTIWTDCLAVLASSSNKSLAMDFINFLLDEQVAAQISERLLFASANRQVRDRLPSDIRHNPAVYPPEEAMTRMEWMEDVSEAMRYYDRGWTELKVQ
ncbi:MAG TPA: spermidine/putrescine ABC transporter substrate-binding protein [Nitrospirales bacterium]|nr:spermidine/putrescine ABC transporter substrate-binding protein [Nitrospirales bacterium]